MVQRKAPPKLLGIQADHANNKLEKPRFGRILGPSSPKHQDGLTKKMKKSRSITKRSDPEGSTKNPKFRNEVSLPGKPPPSEATPEKQFPVRRSESSPNYMKSTSSSDARKEHSQVSPQTKTTPEKSPKSSGSGYKSAKTLTKTPSLKLGRTLTKSPSFKPARTSSSTKKKSPQVVLCDDVDVQRATCSSTLKESKFPSYLELSHGATESEGTSAMKVCPYTYCSLNGHRHAQHPPLKSFLSARRRMLKTQKSTKLGCLSPGRVRPGGDGKKEIQTKHMILDHEPSTQEIDRPSLMEENQNGFVIEIYVRGEKDTSEETNSSITDFGEELELGDHADQNISEVISSKEEQLAEEEALEWTHDHSDSCDVETTVKAEDDGLGPENCDMEWEEGQYSAPSSDGDGENVESDSFSGDCDYDLHLGKLSFGFDDISNIKFDEIPSHEGPEEISEEERAGSESDGSFQNWEREEDYTEEFDKCNYPLPSSFEEMKNSSGEETNEKSKLDDSEGISITLAPIEHQIEEAQEDDTEVLEAETKCPVQIGEDGTTGCVHNDEMYEEDCSSSDTSEVYQFETDGEEVAESPIDKIGDLETKQALPTSTESDVAMEKEHDGPAELFTGVTEAEVVATLADNCPIQLDTKTTKDDLCDGTQSHSFDKKSQSDNIVEDPAELNHVNLSQNKTDNDTDEMEVEYAAMSEPEEGSPSSADNAVSRSKMPFVRGVRKPDQEQPNVSINLRITKCMRSEEELEDPRKFNPREPNYLPVKPDPEAEKVDLKHQMMEERKDSQEWMVDYALRQTVDKLATARKKKVALLVEAFEKVTPVPKYQQSHLRHTPSAFAHTRFVQACS